MKREPYIDINTMRRNLSTPRTGASPAQYAYPGIKYEAKESKVTPIVVGAVSALGSFALLAWMFAERFGWL